MCALGVQGAESDPKTKTLDILANVVNLNLGSCRTYLNSQLNDQYIGLPQKEVDITLVSNHGSVRVSSSFVNNTLRLLYFSEYTGVFLEQHATSTVDMANDFLQSYQNYSKNAFYGNLASMLTNVNENSNSTILCSGVKLEVLNLNQSVIDYIWKFSDENGITAERKNVILSYEHGEFKGFWNNWPLYSIAENAKISGLEATAIALKASENFSYQIRADNKTMTISDFEIVPESLGHEVLSYLNLQDSASARNGDPFTLYPSWFVPLGFDKFYPGEVSGMTVSIWADTGEVSTIGPVIIDSTFGSYDTENCITYQPASLPDTEQKSSIMSTPMILIAAFGTLSILVTIRKKIPPLAMSRRKFAYSRFCTLLLCAVIFSSVLLVSEMPEAKATAGAVNSKSEIYACLTGNGYYVQDANNQEGNATIWISGKIADAFNVNGYTTSNQCQNTVNTTVISDAGADEQSYDRTAVFYAGHKSYLGIQDNIGGSITPSDIHAQTTSGKHFFTFLWVCDQATNLASANGMPAAWTHRDGTTGHSFMSDNPDGFTGSDGLGQCYISFYGFSPMISSYHQTFDGDDQLKPCKYFIEDFYNQSLYAGRTVHAALDFAASGYFGCDYASCILNSPGYSSWWPGGGPGNLSNSGYFPTDFRQYSDFKDRALNRMRVYGDSNIKLSQLSLTLTADDNHNNQLYPTFYIDGIAHSTGAMYITPEYHEIHVTNPNPSAYQFWRFNGYGYFENSYSTVFDQNKALTAHFTDQYLLEIDTTPSPYGNTNYNNGFQNRNTWLHVAATPYNSSAYEFDHWEYSWYYWNSAGTKIEGSGSSSNATLDLYTDRNYKVTPYFAAIAPPPIHTIYLQAYDFTFSNQVYPAVYVDGNYVGHAWDTIYLSEGYHGVYFEDPVWNDYAYRDAYFCYMGYMGQTSGNHWYVNIYSDGSLGAAYYSYSK
jgi:hypothetical protein